MYYCNIYKGQMPWLRLFSAVLLLIFIFPVSAEASDLEKVGIGAVGAIVVIGIVGNTIVDVLDGMAEESFLDIYFRCLGQAAKEAGYKPGKQKPKKAVQENLETFLDSLTQ